jgi:flavin-dependent dehydrogenase
MRSDLVIAGGGPVGLVTAIAGRQRGLRVVVVERSPGLPEKACGEGLMPGAVRVLDRLGVSADGSLEFRGIRFVDGDVVASARFPAHAGRAMSRRRLMRALDARARELGVEILSGHTLRDFEYRGRVLSAQVSAGGAGAVTLRAQLLVGADGLRSGVRRRLGHELPARGPRRFGLQRHYRCVPWTDWVEVHWDDRVEAYVTPLGPDEVGVALLCHGAPAPFDELLSRFPQLRARLAGGAALERVRGAGPFEQRVSQVLAPGVALVGDAAGYLDAVSGEGLSLGFRSALALIDRFASGELWRYPTDHARITATYQVVTRVMLEIARRPRLRRRVIEYLARRPLLLSDLLGIAADCRAPDCSTALGAGLRWGLAPLAGQSGRAR